MHQVMLTKEEEIIKQNSNQQRKWATLNFKKL